MGGGHLDAAGAEVHLRIVVSDHRDLLVDQRQNDLFADDILVALVVGVDAHAAVAQHGLRTGGGDDDLTAAVSKGVADVPEAAGFVHVFDLGVGQGRHAMGAPVDDAAALVDQSLLVEVDKHLPDGGGTALVHGEAGAVPVTGGTQLFLLLDDTVAVLAFPVPDPLQEFFTSQVVAGQALLAQLLLHTDLGGDACVVHARYPQRRIALHPLVADENVLHGGIHGVAHVKLSGHVGRRHDDGEGLFLRVALGVEIAAVAPELIELGLHLFGVVGFW